MSGHDISRDSHEATAPHHTPGAESWTSVCEWVAVEKHYLLPGLQPMCVAPDTIRGEGNLVTLWQLTDFNWMQGGPRATPRFLSTKTHKQFYCAERHLRLLASAGFLRRIGIGIADDEYVDQDTWKPAESKCMNHALWEVACSKQ